MTGGAAVDGKHDPKGAAQEAAAVQAVEIFGTLALCIVAVFVQRHAADPDLVRTLRMRAARIAEGRLARLGIWALAQAERQRQAYEGLTADGH